MQAHNDRWLPFWNRPEWQERLQRRADARFKYSQTKPSAAVSAKPKAELICIERIGAVEIRFYDTDYKSTFFSRILSKMLRW